MEPEAQGAGERSGDAGASVATRLPDSVLRLLTGTDLDRAIGFTVELVTVDSDGWPRIALLSAGEVVALDSCTLRIALWPTSQSTDNLSRAGRATLAFVDEAVAYRVRVNSIRGRDLAMPSELAVFELAIVEVREDVASYATLSHGITFSLHSPEVVLERWRETRRALLAAPSPSNDGNR